MNPYHHPEHYGYGSHAQRQYQSNQNQNQLPPMMYQPGGLPAPMAAPQPPPIVSAGGIAHPSMYPTQAPALALPGTTRPPVTERKTSLIGNNGKYTFELKVDQQPERARMCGFGDKDRRPITPPPCIRLVIKDMATGLPVTPDDLDGTFFVLQVDLWDEKGLSEVNLVRHSGSSPATSISSATTTSFPPTTPDRPLPEYATLYHQANGQAFYGPPPVYTIPMAQRPTASNPAFPHPQYQGTAQYAPPPQTVYIPVAPVHQAPPQTHALNTYTRNLIGSLTVNSSSLRDLRDEQGYWFILQDLSVRTEGWFR